MSAPTGGRWVFSVDTISGFTGVNLGINIGDSRAPVFPPAVPGKFNIEVFTKDSGVPSHPLDPGFNTSITDPLSSSVAPIDNNGFLVGTNLTLGTGNYLVVDSVTGSSLQSGSKITLGSGNQTVVGAKFDTLVGGSGTQILSALLGNETVIGVGSFFGAAAESIWGGSNDSIVAAGVAQIVVSGTGTTVMAGDIGEATVNLGTGNTVTSVLTSMSFGIGSGGNNLIDLTNNNGLNFVLGGRGDTIIGGIHTDINGATGGMMIQAGSGNAGVTALSGSTSSVAGNTVFGTGFGGSFNFNPDVVAGKGDLINLSGMTGKAQINAFANGTTQIAAHDTIFATNNVDSVFGGDGDRIGTGNGSVVGGAHQWSHSDTVAGGAVGFGSNDTVASTTYDTMAHIATRHPTVAGTSSAQVTVGGFNTATDFVFYQNESAGTTNAIIATAQTGNLPVPLVGTAITLPDGTVMTLVGVTPAQLTPALFKS